jgi:prophage regulatory protein
MHCFGQMIGSSQKLSWWRDLSLRSTMMNHAEPLSAQPQTLEAMPRLLRLPAVLQATGLARSTVYRMMAEHTFPAPVKLAKRAVGWRHDDVRQWTNGRPTTSR